MPQLQRPTGDPRDDRRNAVLLALGQRGRISAAQLRRLGWSRDRVATHVTAGWLVREHRGVYRLAGAPASFTGRAAAAVLAVDPVAVLSHRTGLELHGVLEHRPDAAVHVTTERHHRSRTGVVVHQAPLRAADVVRIDGLRVTTLTRSLVDAAAIEPAGVIREAVREAEFLRRLDARGLLAAGAGRPAAALLRGLAAERLPVDGELIDVFERRFATFLLHRGFPPAEVNCRVVLRAPRQLVRLDVVWWDAGLALELDGRQAHATAKAFDDDRERDRRLGAQFGLRIVRVTWAHLDRDADALERDLKSLHAAGLLAARAA